jgi:hypothetical protein
MEEEIPCRFKAALTPRPQNPAPNAGLVEAVKQQIRIVRYLLSKSRYTNDSKLLINFR